MESLYSHFFTNKTYTGTLTKLSCKIPNILCTLLPFISAHRALPDVEALDELLSEKALVGLLPSLPKRSPRQQIQLWNSQKDQRRRTSTLLYSLGRQITATQAKRLDSLNLSYDVLCEIRVSCSGEDFQKTLLQRGVRSKKLREKLISALDQRRK